MKRETCSACRSTDLELFLDLGVSPIADAYTTTRDEVAEVYPLQLVVCQSCWLVQLTEVVDHHTLFGTGYSFYSSASAPLSEYHRTYAQHVIDRWVERSQDTVVVEVGCNDGDFLRHFHDVDCSVYGVDPATGPATYAQEERGLHVFIEPFSRRWAETFRNVYGSADVVVANHVLAHVEDVDDVLAGISHIMKDDGVAFIEVQYLPDLLVNNAFDLVYHEHRNFFSLTALRSATERHDLQVCDVELTDRQGGSLRVTLRRRRWVFEESLVEYHCANELWLGDVAAFRGFQGRVERIRGRLRRLVAEAAAQGSIIGYGAPAKATTLLNYCGLRYPKIEKIIDTTPAKQGRFVPGTGVQIVAPTEVDLAETPTTVLVLAHNYLGTIMRNHPEHRGRWLVPIPGPVLL